MTVVIATRNRAQRLHASLESLMALPERPPIIVVDNGSTDPTAAVAARFAPLVRVLRLTRNAGAQARNAGVAQARTPYVAFADDDSWWAPGALGRAADLFATHPRLALLAARTLVGPDERLDPVSRYMATAPLGREPDLPGPTVLGFLACAAVVRRDAFLAAGGFDPVVFFMGEEARLAYDLAVAGWGLAYCANVVAHHHPSADGSAGKRALARRNEALTAWMRRPVGEAIGRTAALAADAGRDPGARRMLWQLLCRLPRALARRRAPDPRVEAALRRLAADTASGPAANPADTASGPAANPADTASGRADAPSGPGRGPDDPAPSTMDGLQRPTPWPTCNRRQIQPSIDP